MLRSTTAINDPKAGGWAACAMLDCEVKAEWVPQDPRSAIGGVPMWALLLRSGTCRLTAPVVAARAFADVAAQSASWRCFMSMLFVVLRFRTRSDWRVMPVGLVRGGDVTVMLPLQ
jgi:hypothetical protein